MRRRTPAWVGPTCESGSFNGVRTPQTLEQAFALAQQAVALDDSLPGAHAILGYVYLWKKQHEQAIAEAERAIALDPNDADGYVTSGGYSDLCRAAGGSHRVDREGDAPQPPLSASLLIQS